MKKSENYFHPQSIVENPKNIGKNTNVWAFSHILPDAIIGNDCNVCDLVFIENQVLIGDRVTIKSGVQIWDGIEIEEDVFVGPNVTFTNDKFPRSKKYKKSYPTTKIKRGASLGANSTILPGITIGENAMVGAGSVVTNDVPDNGLVMGNPARLVRFLNEEDILQTVEYKNNKVEDSRGSLLPIEFKRDIPFNVERIFFVYNVPSLAIRGQHAHRLCHQYFLCLTGQVTIKLDNGKGKVTEQVLDSEEDGIHVPPFIWSEQFNYSDNAVLLVICSLEYNENDYIRSYDEFLEAVVDQ